MKEPAFYFTTNDTEQIIGKMKKHSHTLRGYRSIPGMLAALLLAGLGAAC